ncbi:hypothetical protein KP509_11G083200 [Ceratopteris richardii]|uniref:SHSP domain-containing protein n=1 Tax=Ceratopteris richardii TaxID=49495 RepID=A0A8T2TWU7_CERRI|nr:hypothetical protein KP509_11G083200 [Ceratopteris richardii]
MNLQVTSVALGERGHHQQQNYQNQESQEVEIAPLSNPIVTPTCSVPGSRASNSSVPSAATTPCATPIAASFALPARDALPKNYTAPGSLSPKVSLRSPARNSLKTGRAAAASSIFRATPPPRTPSRSATPRSRQSASSTPCTPIPERCPRVSASNNRTIFQHHPARSYSISKSQSPIFSASEILRNITSSPGSTSLSEAVTHILSSSPGSAHPDYHPVSNPTGCSRACCHECPRKASREPKLGSSNAHHQVEPYARSRKADPQGYLFTCYLDYSRSVKPPPPACFDSYVRPESLQYSTCNSACDTPRSVTSTSSSSLISLPANYPLYSRPPTPAPLFRGKEVHRIAMAGVPVDVKELANCYLFVAEIPGLKNTDVKYLAGAYAEVICSIS